MAKFIAALIYFVICLGCQGQTVFYSSAVVGNYQMEKFKLWQNEILADFEAQSLEATIIQEFPASIQMEAGVDIVLENFSIGPFVNYSFTKGKVSYQDFSGFTASSQNINRILIGGKISTVQEGVNFYGKIGFNYSSLELISETKIQNRDLEVSSFDFSSIGGSLEPGIQWQKTLGRLVFLLSAGYEFNLNGQLNSKDVKDTYLVDSMNSRITADFSGLRIGFGLGFAFR